MTRPPKRPPRVPDPGLTHDERLLDPEFRRRYEAECALPQDLAEWAADARNASSVSTFGSWPHRVLALIGEVERLRDENCAANELIHEYMKGDSDGE